MTTFSASGEHYLFGLGAIAAGELEIFQENVRTLAAN
jgi:hypothetical protein